MKTKKYLLIQTLTTAANSLEKDIINYNWVEQSSCNCGVVLQAALGLTPKELQTKFDAGINSIPKEDVAHKSLNWKSLTQGTCSATGIPFKGVVLELYKKGFAPENITHLEYLSDKTILKEAGNTINLKSKREKLWRKNKEVVTKKTSTNWLKKLIGKKDIVTTYGDFVEQDLYYYQRKTNVIAYLKAWVSILGESAEEIQDAEEKRNKLLLQAVADENYMLASQLQKETFKSS